MEIVSVCGCRRSGASCCLYWMEHWRSVAVAHCCTYCVELEHCSWQLVLQASSYTVLHCLS